MLVSFTIYFLICVLFEAAKKDNFLPKLNHFVLRVCYISAQAPAMVQTAAARSTAA